MRCSFCSKDIEPGKGIIHIDRVGKTFSFCSSKCKKNMLKLKRNPRKVKWVTKRK